MPNHVQLVLTTRVKLAVLTHTLKRVTDESKRIAGYIENNPVRAGVAASPDRYPWSSACTACSAGAGY